ncbi:MAG TPA: hypothetical protein VEN30_09860 [Paraburkholderia sp.]|nr:hypothetical protein [Paraburkholderia sp.]
MNKLTSKPTAASPLDRQTPARAASVRYQRHLTPPRALFATPSVDLQTLVIADALKRKAQAEIQREALRDAVFEMPASPEWTREREAGIQPSDFDD